MADRPRSFETARAPGESLRSKLQTLYFGDNPLARRFRYGLIAFDLVTIGVFLVASFAREAWWLIPLDVVLAAALSVEFAARLYAEPNRRAHLLSFATLADIVVIVSLLLPVFVDNLGFLRIARALRLLRSYHLLRDLRQDSPWFRSHEDVIQRTVTLAVFIFVVTLGRLRDPERHQPADRQLCRRALFHHHDADDDGVRRHHLAGFGRAAPRGRHHGGRGQPVPSASPGAVPAEQGTFRVPRLRPPRP
jgi:hypothetical protein